MMQGDIAGIVVLSLKVSATAMVFAVPLAFLVAWILARHQFFRQKPAAGAGDASPGHAAGCYRLPAARGVWTQWQPGTVFPRDRH